MGLEPLCQVHNVFNLLCEQCFTSSWTPRTPATSQEVTGSHLTQVTLLSLCHTTLNMTYSCDAFDMLSSLARFGASVFEQNLSFKIEQRLCPSCSHILSRLDEAAVLRLGARTTLPAAVNALQGMARKGAERWKGSGEWMQS